MTGCAVTVGGGRAAAVSEWTARRTCHCRRGRLAEALQKLWNCDIREWIVCGCHPRAAALRRRVRHFSPTTCAIVYGWRLGDGALCFFNTYRACNSMGMTRTGVLAGKPHCQRGCGRAVCNCCACMALQLLWGPTQQQPCRPCLPSCSWACSFLHADCGTRQLLSPAQLHYMLRMTMAFSWAMKHPQP